MSDLIDRQQAIGVVDVYLKRLCNYIGTPKDTELYALERGLLTSVKIDIGELPSAELGTNLAEVGTDTISRQAATDALRKMQTYKLFSGDDMLLIDQAGAMTELMLLPSAQPEPKHGEWLERDVIDEPKGKHITQWQSAKCSVCGHYHTTPYLYSFSYYNFCPACGADMRKRNE